MRAPVRLLPLTLAVLSGAFVADASAAPPASPPLKTAPAKGAAASLPQLHLDIQKAKLENGLRIVLSVDHTSPTVAVDVMYDVGSRNEERGHSGFAHLFEHMMFQGSGNVPRGEHARLVSSHGGTLNANTSSDRTNYFDLLPSSELPLGMWLESDRMKTLDVSQANLDNQRQVVEEEFRMRILNAAYVPAELRLEELVFQGYWPYEHSTIGSMKDLDAAQLDWVKAFHDAYYAPNEAVLAIAGDFDPAVALEKARAYFGDAKPFTEAARQGSPIANVPKYDPGPIAEQSAPREDVVEDTHARFAEVLYGWPVPAQHTPDSYALAVASGVLAGGESARLYKTLVHDKAIAVDVTAGSDGNRGPDMFEITAKVSGKGTLAEVEKVIAAALESLAKTPPSDEEMLKVRNHYTSGFLFNLASNYARAAELARYELYWGDAGLLNSELDKYVAVTKEDVSRVVAKYLVPNHRSRVEVKPGQAGAEGEPNAKSAKPADASKAAAKPSTTKEKKP